MVVTYPLTKVLMALELTDLSLTNSFTAAPLCEASEEQLVPLRIVNRHTPTL